MELTKQEAIDFFAILMYGEHHCYEIKEHGSGWRMEFRGCLATTDFNNLTRLVVLAHDFGIRAEIVSRGMKLYIAIHKRDINSDRILLGHPTLESNTASTRDYTDRWMEKYQVSTSLQNRNTLTAPLEKG